FTVGKLPAGEPISVEGFVAMKGKFSGGTWHSAIGAFSKAFERRPRSTMGAPPPYPRRPREEATSGRKGHGIKPRPRCKRSLEAWVCAMSTIDPQIVLRSARAIDAYGPDFSYGHYMQARSGVRLAALLGGVGAVVALSQIGPAREMLLRLHPSGEGPS